MGDMDNMKDGAPGGEKKADEGSNEPVLHTITVDGKEEKLSVEKLIERAQKGTAAEKRMQDAAEAVQFQADVKAAQNNDEAAFRRVAPKMGWSEEQVEATIKARKKAEIQEALGGEKHGGIQEEQGQGQDDDDGDDLMDIDSVVKTVAEKLMPIMAKQIQDSKFGVGQLEPKLQKALFTLVDKDLSTSLEYAVDKDDVLGKFITSGSDVQKKAIRTAVRDAAMRRATEGRDLSQPDEVQHVLDSVKEQVAGMGATPANARVPYPGLGSSTSGSGTLHPDSKPAKRPDKGFASPLEMDEYLSDKLAREMAKVDSDDDGVVAQ